MNLLVKLYMKRHDRHNKTLWTTDYFISMFCLVSCLSKNQVQYFILNKVVTDSNLTRLLLRKKTKQNKTKQTNKQQQQLNAFRSGLSICHKLWDIHFFSLVRNCTKSQTKVLCTSTNCFDRFSWNSKLRCLEWLCYANDILKQAYSFILKNKQTNKQNKQTNKNKPGPRPSKSPWYLLSMDLHCKVSLPLLL